MKHTALLVLLLGALALVGCEEKIQLEGTLGELGNVEFTYRRSCFFGCPLEQPLLMGTRETIEVNELDGDRMLRPRASDTAIARFEAERSCYCERDGSNSHLEIAEGASCESPWTKTCEDLVHVEALAPGETMLELLDGERVVDRALVLVRRASGARFYGTPPDALAERTEDRFVFAAGTQLELRVELYSEDGRQLLAPEGVAWRSTEPSVATVGAFLLGPRAAISAGRDVVVSGLSLGRATIEVDVPGLLTSVEVEVTAGSDAGLGADDDAGL